MAKKWCFKLDLKLNFTKKNYELMSERILVYFLKPRISETTGEKTANNEVQL